MGGATDCFRSPPSRLGEYGVFTHPPSSVFMGGGGPPAGAAAKRSQQSRLQHVVWAVPGSPLAWRAKIFGQILDPCSNEVGKFSIMEEVIWELRNSGWHVCDDVWWDLKGSICIALSYGGVTERLGSKYGQWTRWGD